MFIHHFSKFNGGWGCLQPPHRTLHLLSQSLRRQYQRRPFPLHHRSRPPPGQHPECRHQMTLRLFPQPHLRLYRRLRLPCVIRRFFFVRLLLLDVSLNLFLGGFSCNLIDSESSSPVVSSSRLSHLALLGIGQIHRGR